MTQLSVPAIAFVGKQNSGKTVLLEKIIATLTDEAIRVATVKHHTHAGFEFDITGKDSWRHRQAGSTHTIIVAPDQVAAVCSVSREPELGQIIDTMLYESSIFEEMPQLILVEGYRHGGLPTIELFRANNPNDAERNLGVEGNENIAVVTDMPRIVDQAEALNLPVFGFDDVGPICNFITDRYINDKTV